MISIIDPESPPPNLSNRFFRVLRLSFHDLLRPIDGYRLFDRNDADELVGFLNWLHGLPDPLKLVCHCEAGVSRSAAVAVFAAALSGAAFPRYGAASLANRHVLNVLNACKPGVGARAPDTDPATLTEIEKLLRFTS